MGVGNRKGGMGTTARTGGYADGGDEYESSSAPEAARLKILGDAYERKKNFRVVILRFFHTGNGMGGMLMMEVLLNNSFESLLEIVECVVK